MSDWLELHQAAISMMFTLGAGLALLFVLFATKSDRLRRQSSRLAKAKRLLHQHQTALNRFVENPNVPDRTKLSLLLGSTRLLDENECIKIIKAAEALDVSASDEPARISAQLVELQNIDPKLFDLYEDVFSTGLFAMSFSSDKVERCLSALVGNVIDSHGRRNIIYASAKDKASTSSGDFPSGDFPGGLQAI